jgi:GntR family transcriptional regulator/MocR family aminotransferase
MDAVIIEDDYDGEFLYDAHPQDALQTLDRDGRVFYVGTFSKSLFPSLRKGFVVAPDWAREALIDIKHSADSHTDVVPQAALATFIAEGHLARHIRRMRPIYAQRRRALEQGAQNHWADCLQVLPGNAGLHLSARIVDAAMSQAVIECARRHLPGALPLSAYSVGNTRQHGLCIGYGGVEVEQIASAVRALGVALRDLQRQKPRQV